MQGQGESTPLIPGLTRGAPHREDSLWLGLMGQPLLFPRLCGLRVRDAPGWSAAGGCRCLPTVRIVSASLSNGCQSQSAGHRKLRRPTSPFPALDFSLPPANGSLFPFPRSSSPSPSPRGSCGRLQLPPQHAGICRSCGDPGCDPLPRIRWREPIVAACAPPRAPPPSPPPSPWSCSPVYAPATCTSEAASPEQSWPVSCRVGWEGTHTGAWCRGELRSPRGSRDAERGGGGPESPAANPGVERVAWGQEDWLGRPRGDRRRSKGLVSIPPRTGDLPRSKQELDRYGGGAGSRVPAPQEPLGRVEAHW